MYKQIIIVRKDLEMSIGKICSQVSHASMAFLIEAIRNDWTQWLINIGEPHEYYTSEITLKKDLFEQWINADYTKCVLKAKNKTQLLKAQKLAEEIGLKENEDFFKIYDLCRTEIEPEDDGKTLTCIGFKPLPAETADKIGKKFQLYS